MAKAKKGIPRCRSIVIQKSRTPYMEGGLVMTSVELPDCDQECILVLSPGQAFKFAKKVLTVLQDAQVIDLRKDPANG